MKIFIIFVSLALSIVVEGNMLAAAVRGIEPIILSFGAAFAAFSGLKSQPNYNMNENMSKLRMSYNIFDKVYDWEDFLNDEIPDVKPENSKVSQVTGAEP